MKHYEKEDNPITLVRWWWGSTQIPQRLKKKPKQPTEKNRGLLKWKKKHSMSNREMREKTEAEMQKESRKH